MQYIVAPNHMIVARAGAKHAGDVIEPRELSGGMPHVLELVANGALIPPAATSVPGTGAGEGMTCGDANNGCGDAAKSEGV